MSTTHNLPFVRFTRQVETEPMALLSTNVAAAAASQLLQAASWIEQTEATPTFPPRAAMLTDGTPSAAFDAYKYVGDYADGKQVAYAGAVAYRFKVPAAALTGPTDITSIALPIYVDRWLVDGIRVAAYLSDSPAPPSAWATIRAGDVNDDAVLPMTYTDPGGERIVVEKNGTTTLTWPSLTDSKKYVYVMLTLEDYDSVRGFWIEGASLIRGAAAVTTFAASVAADAVDAYNMPIATYKMVAPDTSDRPAVYPANGKSAPYDDLYGCKLITSILYPGVNQSLTVTDPGLVYTSAVINQATSSTRIAEVPLIEADLTNTLSAGVDISYITIGEGNYLYINIADILFPLTATFNQPTKVTSLRFADAFSTYPSWLRMRLNVYAESAAGLKREDLYSWLVEKTPYAVTVPWVRGTYSENSLVNVLSMEMTPEGYAAAEPLPAKEVILDGLQLFYVTIHVDRIVSEPPAALVPSFLGESSTPFEYPYTTKRIYIN